MACKRTRRRRRNGEKGYRCYTSGDGPCWRSCPAHSDQCRDIHLTALTILAEIGLAEAPDDIIELLTPWLHG